jgi:hypothetical protein
LACEYLQELSNGGGQGNEGCAGVQDDAGVVHLGGLLAERDGIKVDLPVGLAPQGKLDELASVEHVVERRDDAVHTDGVVAETHDAVEPAEGKGKTGLGGGLSEVLVLHLEVADLEDIVGHEAAQLAGSVADLERGAVLLVRRRRGRVILGVQVAGDRVALGRRDPEVGAARVEDDLERLGWRAEGDLGEVWAGSAAAGRDVNSAQARLTLRVQKVADGHGVGAVGDVRRLEDLLHVRLGLDAHVLLAERGSLLLDVGVLLSRVSARALARDACRVGCEDGLRAAPRATPSSAACGACRRRRSRPRPRGPLPTS